MSAPLRPRTGGVRRESRRSGVLPPYPLTVGVVGAGRVGAVLGAALGRGRAPGGRRLRRLRGLPRPHRPPAAARPPTCPPTTVARAATDLLLIAVPDDALAGVVAGLADDRRAARPARWSRTPPARTAWPCWPRPPRVGARPLALHPAMTFTGDAGRPVPAARHRVRADRPGGAAAVRRPAGHRPGRGARVGRRGRPAALPRGAGARREPPGHPGQRGGRPAARGRGRRSRRRCSAPLLHAALDNALRLGDAALTGPVSRGDAGTVGRHLDRLAATAPQIRTGVSGAGPAHRGPGHRGRPAAPGRRRAAARRAGRSPIPARSAAAAPGQVGSATAHEESPA